MIASGRFDDGTLQGVLAALPTAVLALNSAGLVELWNASAEQMLGWSAAEVLGKRPPLELPHPISGPDVELRITRKDGTPIDLQIRTIPWTNSADQLYGSLVFLTDLTSRHAIERTVEELTAQGEQARSTAQEHLRFRELLEAAPDAIIEVDASGRIVLLNKVTELMFGYTRDELLNQPVEILIPQPARASHRVHRRRYWDHPTTRPIGIGLKLEGQRKNGSKFSVEISLSPVKFEGGFRVSAIIRDVSERKLAEEQLRAIQAAYTDELAATNRELEARNLQIKQADRMKSEFLSGMSHELRTPLHTIIGFTELLEEELEGLLNEKQHRFMRHIHKDSQHLLALINDVLDLSKIESGRLELLYTHFSLRDALEDAVSSIRPRATTKSIVLETTVPSQVDIFADRLRFTQILYNLLSNAVKFTPEGGRVAVEVRVVDGSIEISVSDTGIGIAHAEQESVFDKFYQVGQRQAGGHEGTGLGLAITRQLVEKHGGTIRLKSEPGKGSRFTFTIPCEPF
ncbi:MAG: PAS domain S-box protein [Acidobacteriota bacterium]